MKIYLVVNKKYGQKIYHFNLYITILGIIAFIVWILLFMNGY